jgi:hypothetical protein
VRKHLDKEKIKVATLIDTRNAYKRVIADLEAVADTYEEDALAETLKRLNYRVWEIENIYADVLAKEEESLALSIARHPSNQKR